MSHSKLTKRGKSLYLDKWNPYAKKYINTCCLCGAVGYDTSIEKDGFIIQLDYYVWEETCKLIAKMKENNIKTVPISMNVSRAHFYGKELIHKLSSLIEMK